MKLADLPFPPTTTRVENSTCGEINQRIENETVDTLAAVIAGGEAAIDLRLKELEKEWDIERLLETNASTLALTTLGLGIFHDRKWLAVPVVVLGFLLQHAIQGWCPPIPILRRLGVRTAREIEIERTALRLLRGDFSEEVDNATDAFKVARFND